MEKINENNPNFIENKNEEKNLNSSSNVDAEKISEKSK